MGDKVSVTCCGRTRTYPSRITLESVSKDFMGDYKGNIILAKQNGKLRELFKRIKNDRWSLLLLPKRSATRPIPARRPCL